MKSWIIKKKMNWSNHHPVILISFTVSPLHTNLRVANFQRCEHTFHQCQVWGKLQLVLSSTAEDPLALPSPTFSTSFSQWFFLSAHSMPVSIYASCCTVLLCFSRYCTVSFKMFIFVFIFACINYVKTIINLLQYSIL